MIIGGLQMKTIEFDGSFEGFLTATQHALQEGAPYPGIQAQHSLREGWLFESEYVESQPEIAYACYKALLRAGGRHSAQLLLQAFLADIPESEHSLFEFARLTLSGEESVLGWRQHPAVSTLHKLAHKVACETHRFMGMLRFVELRDGMLYARYAPDHQITLLLARHFRDRMPREKWVIHDIRRSYAVAWNGCSLEQAVEVPENVLEHLSPEESIFQGLWRLFTQRITIEERRNPQLQRRFMPVRYWTYLTEKNGRVAAAAAR